MAPEATHRCRTALRLCEETPPTTRVGRRATAALGRLRMGSVPPSSGGVQTWGTVPSGEEEEEEEDEGRRVGVV